jgi:hypothetical protein
MTGQLTPAQRLAVSRGQLVSALHDPVWMILLQRWLHSQAKASSQCATSKPATPASTDQVKARSGVAD